MAEPKVSILLTLVDKMSQPIQGVRGQLKAWGNDFRSLGKQATDLLNNRLIQGVGLIGIQRGLSKAFEMADEFRVALQKLEGTAKITGVPLAFLQDIAENAARQFGLSKIQASDFAVEMAKLASKAGDVGKSGPALQAFLDIGAARGLTAAETLKAVQQSILGIDEGTDKLFNANPSVLYARFAEAIGTTAGKLTDQQKAQALLNAAMEDGSKVQGTYAGWLDTVAGKTQLAKNRADEAYAAIGTALGGLRVALADATAWLAGHIQAFVGGVQLIGNDIGFFFTSLPDRFKEKWGLFLQSVANTLGESRVLLTLFGDGLSDAMDRIGANGDKTVTEARHNLRALRQAHEEAALDIVGIATHSQSKQTTLLADGGDDRKKLTEEEKKALEKKEKEHKKALEDLQKEAHKRMVELLPPMYQEYLAIKEKFDEAMKSQDAKVREQAEAALRQNHVRILESFAGLSKGITARAQEIRPQLKGISTTWQEGAGIIVERTETAAERFERLRKKAADLGDSIHEQAGKILEFSKAVGAVNPELEQMIAGVGRLAGGLSDVAKAITPDGINFSGFLGGLTGAVLGLQGIVGSLFGESPAERARKELLRKNTEALDRLRSSVGDLYRSQLPGAKIAGFQGLDAGLADQLMLQGVTGIRKTDLAKALMAQGLSVGDMEQLARELGIDLGSSLGGAGFSFQGVRQFFEAIGQFEPGQFGQTFSDQTDFIDALLATTGSTDPRERLALITQALGGAGGSGALSSLIGGADLNSAEGVANLRAQLASFITQANSPGGIDPTIFGGLSGQEFIRAIEMVAGILGEFTFDSLAPVAAGITSSFAAPSFTGAAASAEMGSIAVDIAATARHTARMVELLESGSLGTTIIQSGSGSTATVDALDELLQLQRDLYDASTGTA